MLRLPPHRLVPCDAEPSEVFIDGGLEFRLAAGQVDVLDAQQQAAAGLTRQIKIQQRRKGVAEMQITVRARRKAEDGGRHYLGLVMAGLVPAIHVFQHYFMKVAMFYIRPSDTSSVRQITLSRVHRMKTWMAGTSPAMTKNCENDHPPQHPGRPRRGHPRAGKAGPAAQADI